MTVCCRWSSLCLGSVYRWERLHVWNYDVLRDLKNENILLDLVPAFSIP